MVKLRKNRSVPSKRKTAKSQWTAFIPSLSLRIAAAPAIKQVTDALPRVATSAPSHAKFNTALINLSGAGAFIDGTVYTFNPIALITQGTAENQRLGSEITIQECILRGSIGTNTATSTSTDITYRFMLLESTTPINTGAAWMTTAGGGLAAADVFFNTVNPALLTPNPRLVNVLHDELITIQTQPASVGTKVSAAGFSFVVNMKSHWEYKTGSVFGVVADMYWVVTAFYHGGTLGTSQVGEMICESVVMYTD